ncbi:MAG: MBL fold metallo-hydrolase [Candidatus Neomarinimicrobiota bacterium]
MKIAEYELYPILTSQFRLDGGAMFGIIPKTLWERKMPSDELNRIQMVTRSLLLVSENKRILIDTGNGDKWQEKFKKIYEIDTKSVNLDSSLAEVGLTAEDITDIICTHLHFDHAGGNTKIEEGKLVPTFPNAKYWINRVNWEVANSPSEKDQGSFMQADWAVLAENDMIKLVDGTAQFLPNIDLIISNGHTPGMMLPVISDDNNTLVYGADLIPTSAHISLPWVMAYDVQPVVTIEEKKQLYSAAVKDNWILFFEHDPDIEACTIQYDGKQYKKKNIIKI